MEIPDTTEAVANRIGGATHDVIRRVRDLLDLPIEVIE